MLDYILVGIVLFFFFFGIYKGFIQEILGIIGFIAGFYMAFTYMPPLSQYLTSAIPDLPAWIAPPIGFILIFFLIVLLFRWLSVILAKVLTWSLLGWLNRFGGAFFGLFKGCWWPVCWRSC
jgi:membrane protein required for colicin V production